MDRTNILEVFDEVSQALSECKTSIKFSQVTDTVVDEPSVIITASTDDNINITYYLSSQEAQEITKSDLEYALNFLLKQESYRRSIIFRSAISQQK